MNNRALFAEQIICIYLLSYIIGNEDCSCNGQQMMIGLLLPKSLYKVIFTIYRSHRVDCRDYRRKPRQHLRYNEILSSIVARLSHI